MPKPPDTDEPVCVITSADIDRVVGCEILCGLHTKLGRGLGERTIEHDGFCGWQMDVLVAADQRPVLGWR